MLWDHHIPYNSANTPHEHGKTTQNTADNWISLSGHGINYLGRQETVDGFSKYWMIGNTLIEGNKWLGSVFGSYTQWNNPSNWTKGNVPLCTDNVIIPQTTYSPTLPTGTSEDPVANAKSIEIETGAVLNGESGNITICGGIATEGGKSSWTNYGTFNQGTSTVTFNYPRSDQAETSTISGNSNFYNMIIADSTYMVLQLGATVSVSGTLTQNGFLDARTFANTFIYNGSGNQTVVLPNNQVSGYHGLTLSGDGTKTLPSDSLSISGNLIVNATISATGNTIIFDGIAPQSISGTASATFNNVTVNNLLGVTFNNPQTINGSLTLTNGLITTGTNSLTLGCDATIAGQSSTRFIDGKLSRIYCGPGSKDFPIGKGGNYRPLTVNYTTLTGTSTVTAEQFESSIAGTNPTNITVQSGRYWTISQTGGSGFAYNLTLDGSPFNPNDGTPVILKGDGTTNTAFTATFNTPNFTSTGLSSFSNFAVASECTAPTIDTQPSNASTCTATGTPTFSVTATGDGLTYQWQEYISSWNNITNVGVYSNATTATLTITNPPVSMNGNKYRVIVNRDCGSSVTSNGLATLTVNTIPTITLGTNPSVCSSSITANLPYTATTGSPNQYRVDYNATAETAGFTDVSVTNLSSSPIVLTVPTTPGTYIGNLYVKNNIAGCESSGVPFTVTIINLPQGALSGNRICSSETGKLTFTASVGTGSFTVVYHDGTASRTRTGVVSGTPFNVFANPTVTTNYSLVSVQGAYCTRTSGFAGGIATITVAAPTTVTWIGVENNEWNNPGNWSNSLVPLSCDEISIPLVTTHFPVLWSDLSVSNLTVAPGAQFTIGDANNIAATTFTLQSGADGTATFIDNNGTLTATTVQMQQYATSTRPSGRNWYISSPVSAATSSVIKNISGTQLWSYDEQTYTFPEISNTTTPLNVKNGYVAYLPNGTTFNFTGGSFNTGNDTATVYRHENTLARRGFDLVGNPYPSYLNWTNAVKNNLEPTIWYRTVNTQGVYVFDTFNGVGTNNNGIGAVTGLIPPMQSVWVRVIANQTSGTVNFSNTLRSHRETPSNNFRAPGVANNKQKVLRLRVSNGVNSDETILLFNENASNGYDAFDSPKMTNNNAAIPEIFTLIGTEELVINGMKSVENIYEIPVGFRTGMSNTFSIEANEISNFDADTKILIRDNLMKSEHEFTAGHSYRFVSDKVTTTDRFSLLFKSGNAPSGLKNTGSNNAFVFYNHEKGQVTIQSYGDLNGKNTVAIYNALGQQLHIENLTSLNAVIKNKFSTGVYMVTVNNNGIQTTSKVVIK
ncbi:MAG: T9SS type A sorting domain-containing protein [Paludibacter sp.]|nr:T9SS type A sorting domain-containing protein [Paludibacter sp.]